MSDLIPKTADVRDAYSAERVDSTYANRMFDLWLAKYKAKTITNERERIFGLMESHEPEAGIEGGFVGCTCGDFENWYGEHLIALIKGENK
jgi:hypothetical protein